MVWAHKEHYKHWLNTEGCRHAKELVTQVTPGLTQFALQQCRRDLRTLVYLLTGHNTLNPQPIMSSLQGRGGNKFSFSWQMLRHS